MINIVHFIFANLSYLILELFIKRFGYGYDCRDIIKIGKS